MAASVYMPNIMCNKVSDDEVDIIISWPENPKQGTSISYSWVGSLFVRDGSGTSVQPTSAGAFGTPSIVGKKVKVRFTEAGRFATLSTGRPLFMISTSSTAKWTIT